MSTEGDVAAALTPLAIALIEIGVRAAKGELDKAQAAKQTVAALAAAIPREELAGYLTEGGIMRAEILADVAEGVKFISHRDPLDEDEDP